jgi:hypothetical protein
LSLAVVRDLREARGPAGPDEIAAFETDVLAGFVLARAAAGLADATIRSDVGHLEQLRAWFGRPLWDMEPADADAYFGTVPGGGERHAAGPGAGTADLFPVPGTRVEPALELGTAAWSVPDDRQKFGRSWGGKHDGMSLSGGVVERLALVNPPAVDPPGGLDGELAFRGHPTSKVTYVRCPAEG